MPKTRTPAEQTKFLMVVWFLLILFVLGLGLIWVIYGRSAAFLGFLCLIGASFPIGLILIFLFGLDFLVRKTDD